LSGFPLKKPCREGPEAVGVDNLNCYYDPLCLLSTPFLITGLETAELIKYAANVF